ncbi:MAG: hypothetical protein ACE5F5_09765 [Acidimicrobiia bacterium]
MRESAVRWALVGGAAAAILLAAQAASVGGATGLLQVGEASNLRPLIEAELGDLPLAPGPGHDGQIYYAIGLDLDGDEVGPLLDHAGYRYRRILFPLLASGFGLLEGEGLLWGMIVLVVASTAVATGVVAVTARRTGLSEWIALSVVLNPGIWLSVRLLTADVTAIAFMTLGLYAYSRSSSNTGPTFALAALTKDVFVLTPLGSTLADPKQWHRVAVTPLAVLGAWSFWLTQSLGEGFTPRQNLTWPLKGIVDAWSNWVHLGGEEWFYLAFTMGSVAVGLVAGLRRGWLRWPLLLWTALALVSSNWVWDFGNNAARAFAPIIVLAVLTSGQLRAGAGSPEGSAAAVGS